MKKRTFSAEFKAKVVLEVIKGEKELNIIAQETKLIGIRFYNYTRNLSDILQKRIKIINNSKKPFLNGLLLQCILTILIKRTIT